MKFRQYEDTEFSIVFENGTAELSKEALAILDCSEVIVMIGIGRSLRLYTKDEFKEMKAIYDELPPHDSARLRAFFANAEECNLSEGQITISEELLRYAGINGKAKLTFGKGECILMGDKEGCHLRTEG